MVDFLSYSDIQQAAQRIKRFIKNTPILTCSTFNRMFNGELFFKCENFQKGGAFKFRGACNAVFSLSPDQLVHGVATHSSGNFAQALSLAAAQKKCPAYIVMPKTAPTSKIKAVKGYGGKIVFCEPNLTAREQKLDEVVKQTGAIFIHPYNHLKVISGQGSAADEILKKIKKLDAVIAPVGGGGLISGTAIAVKSVSPTTEVIAAEPSGADDAYRSVKAGKIIPSLKPNTIADGLLTSLGSYTFPIIQKYVDEIVTVKDSSIIKSMRLIWERMKIVVEPSGAVPFAAIIENKIKLDGKRIALILSGGNIDLDNLPWQNS